MSGTVFVSKDGKAAPKRFTPIGKMIVVQVVQDGGGATKEESGLLIDPTGNGALIMPDGVIYRTPVYQVIAVGPNCLQAKEGDLVLCSHPQLNKVIYANDHYLMIHEERLDGIIEKSEVV